MLAILTGSPSATITTSRIISVESGQVQIEAGITYAAFAATRPTYVPCEQFMAVRVDTAEMADFLASMFASAARLMRERQAEVQS